MTSLISTDIPVNIIGIWQLYKNNNAKELIIEVKKKERSGKKGRVWRWRANIKRNWSDQSIEGKY